MVPQGTATATAASTEISLGAAALVDFKGLCRASAPLADVTAEFCSSLFPRVVSQQVLTRRRRIVVERAPPLSNCYL